MRFRDAEKLLAYPVTERDSPKFLIHLALVHCNLSCEKLISAIASNTKNK